MLQSLVLVLNCFTALAMTMINYYGQLHIGHGMSETAAYFVQRNESVKRLRRVAMDAFWSSPPLFMISMGLNFLSEHTDEEGHFAPAAIIIAVIFALGVVSSLMIKRVVMRAHHAEVDLWKLANDRGTAAAKYS